MEVSGGVELVGVELVRVEWSGQVNWSKVTDEWMIRSGQVRS